MTESRARTDAVDILRRCYVGDDVQRAAEIEREGTNAQVAQLIYDRRTAAGLTQKDLAKLVGTPQSVIRRLEDADNDGHSLTMLQRIAAALGQRIIIDMAPPERRTA